MSRPPSNDREPIFGVEVLDCYLVEATRESVVVGTWGETRQVSSEFTFERFRRSGHWRIVHADGSVTAARRGTFTHRSGPIGPARE
ncbi:hypothetical protein EDE12_11229 [Methylosinus sp. sav-2]|nr:hypothetical protein EDE12_11229 [Methylosinus sp. sav-2]